MPPLVGGVLVYLLVPGPEPLRNFLVWVLSEAIGALALVPLGLLFKPHYLLRHRNPKLLLETLATMAVTLALSWMAITWLPWPSPALSFCLCGAPCACREWRRFWFFWSP